MRGSGPRLNEAKSNYGGTVDDVPALLERLREARGVAAAAPYVYAQAMISRGSTVTGVFLRGVDPEQASSVVDIKKYLKDGSFREMGRPHEIQIDDRGRTAELRGVVIGKELASQLGVGQGDVVSIVMPTGTPSPIGMVPRVKRFVVVGVFDSGMFEYDAGFVYLALEDAQKLLGLKEAVSGVEIRTNRLEKAAEIAEHLEDKVLEFPLQARDWMQLNRNVFIALRLQKLVYFLVLSLMLVVAGFSILATLIMVVMEKRKDIAILKSMGATDASVALIFVLKGLVIGLIGTAVGNAGGLGLSWLISKYKLPLPEGVFYTPTVPVEIVPEYFAAVSAAALVICFFVTLYPASRAVRVVPVDVIRYE